MRIITAKFASTCPETRKAIKKGDTVLYDPAEKKAYHKESQKYLAATTRNTDADHVQAQENAYFDNFCSANNI
jgi:hypothetical protein